MAFTPTTWVDGSAPAITAAQLNRIETGIDEAHSGDVDNGFLNTVGVYAVVVTSAGAFSGATPSGWSVTRDSLGVFTITHGGFSGTYVALATGQGASTQKRFPVIAQGTTTLTVRLYDDSGALVDGNFSCLVVENR